MDMNNNISFCGKPGTSIINHAKREYGAKSPKVKQYIKLYCDTFSKNIDEHTVVDISPDNKYILSHEAFPDVKYASDTKVHVKNELLPSLLNECPITLGRIEFQLFREIISSRIKKGESIKELHNASNGIKNEKSKKNFLDNLNVAEHIIQENPNSQLTNLEYDDMSIRLMEKEAATPGTELFKIVNQLAELTFGT